jgi:hypothetical protein
VKALLFGNSFHAVEANDVLASHQFIKVAGIHGVQTFPNLDVHLRLLQPNITKPHLSTRNFAACLRTSVRDRIVELATDVRGLAPVTIARDEVRGVAQDLGGQLVNARHGGVAGFRWRALGVAICQRSDAPGSPIRYSGPILKKKVV